MLQNALICGLLLWGRSSHAAPPPEPGPGTNRLSGASDDSHAAGKGRRLTGKFLHVTGELAKRGCALNVC